MSRDHVQLALTTIDRLSKGAHKPEHKVNLIHVVTTAADSEAGGDDNELRGQLAGIQKTVAEWYKKGEHGLPKDPMKMLHYYGKAAKNSGIDPQKYINEILLNVSTPDSERGENLPPAAESFYNLIYVNIKAKDKGFPPMPPAKEIQTEEQVRALVAGAAQVGQVLGMLPRKVLEAVSVGSIKNSNGQIVGWQNALTHYSKNLSAGGMLGFGGSDLRGLFNELLGSLDKLYGVKNKEEEKEDQRDGVSAAPRSERGGFVGIARKNQKDEPKGTGASEETPLLGNRSGGLRHRGQRGGASEGSSRG